MKIKKGDNVIILSGEDKGKTGNISEVYPETNSVLIEGINMKKRHYKKSTSRTRSGIEKRPFPIAVSKISILRPGTKDKGSRIGYKIGKDGKKVRVYKQAGDKEIK